jgi:hypothetical protein
MQPTVIPFELSPKWFLITVFILMLAMFVIQLLIKRWTLWQNNISLWMKLKRFEEEEREEANRHLRCEYQNNSSLGADLYKAGRDLESLETRALSGRRNVS